MKKIGQKEILETIMNEARTIKRKRELFKDAQKINSELKQLNEYGHPGAMLGYGFQNSNSPSPIMGLVTPSTYEEVKPDDSVPDTDTDCGCKLDQFPKLEKDIEGFGDEGGNEEAGELGGGEEISGADDIQSMKAEIEELKMKLAKIEGSL